MERWKAVARLMMCVGLLAGFLLLVRLCFLLMPGVAPRWFGCAFLAHAGYVGYVPIPSLRVLLRRLSWLVTISSEWWPFFLLPACLEPGALFLGECSPCTHFPAMWCGRRGQSGAFINVPLHLLTQWGYGTEAGPTCEIRIVMHADNVVEVGQIILDGVCTEWATRHTWLVPVLGFIRPVDWDASKCAPHMQFLQQPQWSNGATLEHNDDIRPVTAFLQGAGDSWHVPPWPVVSEVQA